jgi:predicted RNA polymerase sigma factor
MMFSLCDDALSAQTHTTLILRFVSGLSSAEIARAFLVDVGTVERRIHRGKERLRALGTLDAPPRALPSVLQALYLLFNEGYQGSDHEPAASALPAPSTNAPSHSPAAKPNAPPSTAA